jgi:hypothetical protein
MVDRIAKNSVEAIRDSPVTFARTPPATDTGDVIVEAEVRPGERLADIMARLREEHGEFSELRVGATIVGITEDKMRPCGRCDFCCHALGVAELKKYPRQVCRHLERHLCTIYERRPTACRTFNCSWKHGNWPEEWRPDKIGCVVAIYEDPGDQHLYAVINVDSQTVNRDAADVVFRQLCDDFPEVKEIVDDRQILVVKADAGVFRGRMLKRSKGQYEEARDVVEEELA